MVPSTDLSWAKLVLGGVVSPGLCAIPDAPREDKWDVQSAKGKKGATTVLNSSDPGEFTVIFDLSDDPLNNSLEEWPEFQELIESTTNGPTPKALPVYHPSLALAHYTEVCKKSVGLLIPSGKGRFTVTCKFIEYRPPKPMPTKPATPGNPGAGYVGGAPSNSQLADAQKTLDQLTAQSDRIK